MVTRLDRWLFPTLFGPLLSAWAIALALLCRGADRDAWFVALLVASIFGGLQGLGLVFVDAVLLRGGLRLLPMGTRAWAMGLAASPMSFGALVLLWPKHRIEPPGTLVVGLLLATALVLRLVFSPRFGQSRQ